MIKIKDRPISVEWVLGILVLISIGVFSYFGVMINSNSKATNTTVQTINSTVVRIEQKQAVAITEREAMREKIARNARDIERHVDWDTFRGRGTGGPSNNLPDGLYKDAVR